MPSQRRWRERLLGSLQGQLQLATYLVVFAGFTGASTAGLWVGQRNLIHNETQTLRSSDYDMVADYYAGLNATKVTNGKRSIKINSTSVELDSEWMQLLSSKTSGEYIKVEDL